MISFQFLKQRSIVWVWNHTPTCAEMTRLASRSLDHPLSIKTRLTMWLHFPICVCCERYKKQLKLLHRFGPVYGQRCSELGSVRMSNEARQRMKSFLRAHTCF